MEDGAEQDAEEGAGRIPRDTLALLNRAEGNLSAWWSKYGNRAAFDLAVGMLGGKYELAAEGIDLGLSKRHTGGAKFNSCYWSSAKAFLTNNDLSGATYTEGVLVAYNMRPDRSRGVSRGRCSLAVELEGYLRLADGRVVDPVALVNAERRAIGSPTAVLESAVYVPIKEFSREEVADRWDEIPLSLAGPRGVARTVAVLEDVLGTFDATMAAARTARWQGRARWAPPR